MSETIQSKFSFIDEKIVSGNLRKDGKLVFSGLANGKLLVHEVNKKLCLRNYQHHKLQINSIDVAANLTDVLSCSNDLSLRIFNLSRTEPVLTFEKAHSDYVKVAKYIDENVILSGGFDKNIKLWDVRAGTKAVKSLLNQYIVNDLNILDETVFLSTAENFVNRWDLGTGKVLQQVNPIQSNIERLRVNNDRTRLFAFSPGEKFIKVLELNTLDTLFSLKFPKELSTFDISPNLEAYALAYTYIITIYVVMAKS